MISRMDSRNRLFIVVIIATTVFLPLYVFCKDQLLVIRIKSDYKRPPFGGYRRLELVCVGNNQVVVDLGDLSVDLHVTCDSIVVDVIA